MYKVTVYVMNINDTAGTPEDVRNIMECDELPEFCRIGEIEIADIGEWNDGHVLNQRSTPLEKFEEYFKP